MTDKKLIYSKIPVIMSKVGVVGKDKTNTMQHYKFRGIDDMYNALNKHLAEEGVFITSEVTDSQREERESKSGGALIYTILTMKFKFYAEDGSFVESTTTGEAMDSGDKSANKAMSTAYKYALMQIFCIPTEEEKDTEYNSPEVNAKKFQTDEEEQQMIDDMLKLYPEDKFVKSLGEGLKKYGKLTPRQHDALENKIEEAKAMNPEYKDLIDQELDDQSGF